LFEDGGEGCFKVAKEHVGGSVEGSLTILNGGGEAINDIKGLTTGTACALGMCGQIMKLGEGGEGAIKMELPEEGKGIAKNDATV